MPSECFLLCEVGPPDPFDDDSEARFPLVTTPAEPFGRGRIIFLFTTAERARSYADRNGLWHTPELLSLGELVDLLIAQQDCGVEFVTLDAGTPEAKTSAL